MPAYGIPQSGPQTNSAKNLTSLQPGDGTLVLFDGTETPATTLASVAFSRGPSVGGADNGCSFDAYGMGASADTVIDVQAANHDIDGEYCTVGQITADANGNGNYTDIGRSAFYRVKLSTYTSAGMPKVTVMR